MSGWLGLDIGTSSLKALVVDDTGRALARADEPYSDCEHALDVGEQDPDSWVLAARRAVAHCVGLAGPPQGVGLTGQVPTLVLVGDDGRPVRPALTWQDHRAESEAELLDARLGPSEPLVGVDVPWSAGQMAAKLLWISRHEPEVRRRTSHVMQPKDYLGLLLTGSPLTDRWSAKGVCDIRTGEAAAVVAEACEWEGSALAPTAAAWASRGVTRGDALGLPGGIPVSVGWSDALASMLAVGAFAEPRSFVVTGTSDIAGMSLPTGGGGRRRSVAASVRVRPPQRRLRPDADQRRSGPMARIVARQVDDRAA